MVLTEPATEQSRWSSPDRGPWSRATAIVGRLAGRPDSVRAGREEQVRGVLRPPMRVGRPAPCHRGARRIDEDDRDPVARVSWPVIAGLAGAWLMEGAVSPLGLCAWPVVLRTPRRISYQCSNAPAAMTVDGECESARIDVDGVRHDPRSQMPDPRSRRPRVSSVHRTRPAWSSVGCCPVLSSAIRCCPAALVLYPGGGVVG